ncbi:MAG: acyl-CoA dehydrogenase family protein [Actinomycetota bacterium]|nr:acyl-CoA dehydrogenase family protein [Actinomycetota bacterium]
MLFELTPDQDFLWETTAKFLTSQAPVGEIRRRREDPLGYSPDYWRRGADLGWTSLLVTEEHGGGSVSGRGLVDLTLIAHEFGAHAAPGPLGPANVVAGALSRAGTRTDVIGALLAGSATAAWAWEEPGGLLAGRPPQLEIGADGDEVVLNGTKKPVEAAADADHLLVTGRSGDGLTQVLVPAGTAGLSVERLRTVDLTRRFAALHFDHVRLPADTVLGVLGGAADEVEQQLQQALVVQNAETVGAMDRGFAMTVEWAFDRYSFGRPLASYQELKHRFADMKSWLEGGHAISDAAAEAVAAGDADAAHLVSVAKAFIGHYGLELMQDCVQIHGGIGVTFEHDLHLFLRRVTANGATLGTPADHRQRIAAIAIEEDSRS